MGFIFLGVTKTMGIKEQLEKKDESGLTCQVKTFILMQTMW